MLGVRSRDLPGLHDVRAGRHPLPGSRDDGRQDRGAAPGSATRIAVALADGADRDFHAHRDQRRRVPARTADGRRHLSAQSGWIYVHGVLVSSAVDSAGQVVGVSEGEWWRLITAHVPPLRPASPRDEHARPLVHRASARGVLRSRALPARLSRSGLAGSAGALIWSPNALTVGASGAIWGIMGAALVLEGDASTCSADRRWGLSSSTS